MLPSNKKKYPHKNELKKIEKKFNKNMHNKQNILKRKEKVRFFNFIKHLFHFTLLYQAINKLQADNY